MWFATAPSKLIVLMHHRIYKGDTVLNISKPAALWCVMCLLYTKWYHLDSFPTGPSPELNGQEALCNLSSLIDGFLSERWFTLEVISMDGNHRASLWRTRRVSVTFSKWKARHLQNSQSARFNRKWLRIPFLWERRGKVKKHLWHTVLWRGKHNPVMVRWSPLLSNRIRSRPRRAKNSSLFSRRKNY